MRYVCGVMRGGIGILCIAILVLGGFCFAFSASTSASWFLSRNPVGGETGVVDNGSGTESPFPYYGGFARRWLEVPSSGQPNTQPTTPAGTDPLPPPGDGSGAPSDAGKNPSNVPGLESDEALLFRLINEERAKNGLPAYQLDQRLTRLARLKSEDIAKNHYFSHVSPTYGSPYEMLDDAGIDYIRAGENLGQAGNVYVVHYRLMNSSGHKRNILHQYFTHVGIGVVRNGSGVTVTELFIQKP